LEKEQFDVVGKRYDIKNIGKVTGEEVYSCDVNNERIVSIPDKTYRDRTVLPKDKVRHVGESIAACAAETEEEAFAALKKIKVEWGKKWEPVVTLDGAMDSKAPAIYDHVYLGEEKVDIKNNLACERNIVVGDVEEGFKEADIIVDETFNIKKYCSG